MPGKPYFSYLQVQFQFICVTNLSEEFHYKKYCIHYLNLTKNTYVVTLNMNEY